MSAKSTKKASVPDKDTLRPEYRREDLGVGVRGKYATKVREGSNLVLLDPDVAKAFPTPAAVNDALRSLVDIAQRATSSPKPRRKTA
jgi:hypothetical protein